MHGGGSKKDKDGRIVINEKDREKLWKKHMEKILNMENELDQVAETDTVERPVEGVTYEEVIKAMNKMKLRKAAGPSKVNMDMIIASGKFVVIIKKLCQRILDGKDMPEKRKTTVVVPIFKGRCDGLWSIYKAISITGLDTMPLQSTTGGEESITFSCKYALVKRSVVRQSPFITITDET